MADHQEVALSLQKQLEYEVLRRDIKGARDIETLRQVALNAVDFMEAQQRTVNGMLLKGWAL